MKRWVIFPSRYSDKCYVCEEKYSAGTAIAWHPQTKQAMHEECFRKQFHPANVNAAFISKR